MNRLGRGEIITNLNGVDTSLPAVAEGGIRNRIFCLHLSSTSVQNLRNFPRRESLVHVFGNCSV